MKIKKGKYIETWFSPRRYMLESVYKANKKAVKYISFFKVGNLKSNFYFRKTGPTQIIISVLGTSYKWINKNNNGYRVDGPTTVFSDNINWFYNEIRHSENTSEEHYWNV